MMNALAARVVPVLRARALHTTVVMKDIFTIQDGDDFKDKVLKSKEPVIVDFFAT